MAKYVVSIERSAFTVLSYEVEAEDSGCAEDIVQELIDKNDISQLGEPVEKLHSDDEESSWEVSDISLKTE